MPTGATLTWRTGNRACRCTLGRLGIPLGSFDDPDFLSPQVRFDLPKLARLDGLDIVHLQCHIGTDTVSLSRLRPRSTAGLDFSPAALRAARELAVRARLEPATPPEVEHGSGETPDDRDDYKGPADRHDLGETPGRGERQQHDGHVPGQGGSAEHAACTTDLRDLFLELHLRQRQFVAKQSLISVVRSENSSPSDTSAAGGWTELTARSPGAHVRLRATERRHGRRTRDGRCARVRHTGSRPRRVAVALRVAQDPSRRRSRRSPAAARKRPGCLRAN